MRSPPMSNSSNRPRGKILTSTGDAKLSISKGRVGTRGSSIQRRRDVLDGIALPIDSSPSKLSSDHARFLRPAALPGVEALHGEFIRHRYAPHIHDAWTIALVDAGAATFDLEGSRHVAPAGQVFIIPPGAVHTGAPATQGGYRYRVVYLDRAASARAEVAMPATLDRRSDPIVARPRSLGVRLAALHNFLLVDGCSLELGESLASMWADLVDVLPRDGPMRTGRSPRAVRRSFEYIEAHWRDDFTLEDLAGFAGVSTFHLCHAFRQQIGISPSAYRRALRVLAAQRLLRRRTPLAEVALECGFYDQSHLNRHFKSITGVTPGQFARAD